MVVQLILSSSWRMMIRDKMNCQINPEVIKLILVKAAPRVSDSKLGDMIGFMM